MPNNTAPQTAVARRVRVLAATLLAAGLSVAFAQTTSETPPPDPSTAIPPAAEDEAAPTAPREPEAPIDATGDLSTLEYEPTESISEDKSVAFPIDI